eukprot:CAMPEP_0117420038 /NCGR_PEP_ID=MMETSP0758-20121206/1467_1 /TAXON_ID=63605 /ORGANISM="Percolomonas cosmopolitus, Strain AE-1 (ATCC 50343)" /LENGTH=118 /DNA_ID=CAMNT_0005201437 /DNA_START=232 /DNA_END=585 /DNA_ORIENTATION=+
MYSKETQNDFYSIEINGTAQHYCIVKQENTFFVYSPSHPSFNYLKAVAFSELEVHLANHSDQDDLDDDGGYIASLPAKILEVKVKNGDHVKKGQTLVIIESMKMEVKILALSNGIVSV